VLEDWQRSVIEGQPAAFLRGLFHSDGCRASSADIRELCCWALDLVDIPWRQSNRHVISVSTRAGVARLDELIGLKF
jgi:hypothetical protein